MDESIKFFVGLDAHKDSIAIAVCEAGREPSRFAGTLGPDVQGGIKTLRKYGPAQQVSVVYEAGPTGYGLYRALCAQGYRCEVIAPSLVSRRAGERIKTDRRDCARLAELSRAGELKAFLLRQERRYPGKTPWTKMHERWITEQRFDHAADQIVLTEYQLAVQAAQERFQRLNEALTQAVRGWCFECVVASLRALRGVDTVCAIGLVCEIGDIHRFASARQLMGYRGLVPSEHSNGTSVRRGSITKTGNAHARRLLTEAAWNNRFAARMSQALRDRSKTLPPEIRNHAWKAQMRLCGRFAQLSSRGVQTNKV